MLGQGESPLRVRAIDCTSLDTARYTVFVIDIQEVLQLKNMTAYDET